MILYYSNIPLKRSKVIPFSERDYLLASIYLSIPQDTLRIYIDRISEISPRQAEQMSTVKRALYLDKIYTIYEDSTIVIHTQRKDWVTICFVFILASSTVEEAPNNLKNFIAFAQAKIENFKKVAEMKKQIEEIYLNTYRLGLNKEIFNYFNYDMLRKECNKRNIRIKIEDNFLFLTWNNVEVQVTGEQIIRYNKIILKITKEFFIKGYSLTVHNFTYDSDENLMELEPLHPNITSAGILGYGRNNFLEFINLRDYSTVIEILDEEVKATPPKETPKIVLDKIQSLIILKGNK